MKPVVFHPEAQEEFQEAEYHYESQQRDLATNSLRKSPQLC